MIKYKVKDAAADLGVSNKEIIEILEKHCGVTKKTMTTLEESELDVIFDVITKKNKVENFDEYFAARNNKLDNESKPQQEDKPAKQNAKADNQKKKTDKNDKKPNNKDAKPASKQEKVEVTQEKSVEESAPRVGEGASLFISFQLNQFNRWPSPQSVGHTTTDTSRHKELLLPLVVQTAPFRHKPSCGREVAHLHL